uniref:Uncharacterized protein n=1 Tax=Cannabis sativa TaxID=3483 RepID=A0A803QSA8_CANSA
MRTLVGYHLGGHYRGYLGRGLGNYSGGGSIWEPEKIQEKGKAKASPATQEVNDSIWEMDQKEIYFRSYGMLESYATRAELLCICENNRFQRLELVLHSKRRAPPS